MSLLEPMSQSSFDEAAELPNNAISIVPPARRKGPQPPSPRTPQWPTRS